MGLPKSDGTRCFDPTLWIDPKGRLWYIFNRGNKDTATHNVWARICDDPDASPPVWGAEFRVGYEAPFAFRMNKPTVLSTGEWIMPVTHAAEPTHDWFAFANQLQGVGISKDEGRSWKLYGALKAPKWALECMITELRDGRLWLLTRTGGGFLWESHSADKGVTWDEPKASTIANPGSRFFMRRLASWNLLLVNHYKFKGRSHLTAQLSTDDGATWNEGLLLDERSDVSYPDGVQDKDGLIWITYDRDRNGAGEILLAKFREEDVKAGKEVSGAVSLKQVINKLDKSSKPQLESGSANNLEVIHIAKFKGDRAAAVSITLDDGLRNQDDIAVPLLNQYGFKATFFVIPGLTPETNEEEIKKKPGDLGGICWPHLKDLAAQGHEIANHTWTHVPLTKNKDGQSVDMEPAKLDAQVAKAYEAIKERIGVAPFTFATPGNGINDVVRTAAHKYHPVIREHCERFGAWPPTSKDFTAEKANAIVDRYLAQGKPLVWMIHAITDGYNALSGPDVFEDHLKYLKSREEVLWIDTFANVMRYTMERDAAKLTQSVTKQGATFTLECALDPNQFHDPLTVVVPVKNVARAEAKREDNGMLLPVEVQKDRILILTSPSPKQVMVKWWLTSN